MWLLVLQQEWKGLWGQVFKMKEEPKKWMEQAEADLVTAQVNFDGERYYAVVQFCQQCLEKALKSMWLDEKKKEFPYIHDLTFFMKRLELPKKFEVICKDLTTAYAETRYPTEDIPLRKFNKEDAEEILNRTSEVIGWIREKK